LLSELEDIHINTMKMSQSRWLVPSREWPSSEAEVVDGYRAVWVQAADTVLPSVVERQCRLTREANVQRAVWQDERLGFKISFPFQ